MAENISDQPSRGTHAFIILSIAILLIVLELAGNFPNTSTPFERLELAAGDTAFRLRGELPSNDDIVIVAIDDDSLNWVNERWPWSRRRIAEIVDWLNQAGAKVIALDIFLFDPSSDPAEDQVLAQAIGEANAAVTVNQVFSNQNNTRSTIYIPEPVFLEVLDGYGITEIERDDDAIVRAINAFKAHQDQIYYNWAFEIVRVYLGIDPPSNPSLASLTFNGQEVPLNQRGKLLINFAGPAKTFDTYSAAYVPLGDYPPEVFKDKIVLIGGSSETLQDLYPTPYSATTLTPGVEVIANAVTTILSGEYYRIAPPWMTILLILFFGLVSLAIVQIPRPTAGISLMLGGIAIYFIIRMVVFFRTGWEFAIFSPSLMLFLGVVAPTLEQAVAQEVEKRRIRNLFSRFISPEMVGQMIDTQDMDSLNKRTELTILFSDIRGFTTLSERLAPEEVVALLNPYLQAMSGVIHKYGGTVDKYEGDAIIAFFGEPIPHADHAVRAARAAMDMRHALKELNETWRSQGRFMDVFEMGIGLNTGEVFVGLIGSEQRVNYTVIGDTANLAARLQDQTKELGHPILISGETNNLIQDQFDTEFVTERVLKGKSEPVRIYRLLGPKGTVRRTII